MGQNPSKSISPTHRDMGDGRIHITVRIDPKDIQGQAALAGFRAACVHDQVVGSTHLSHGLVELTFVSEFESAGDA